MITTIRIPDDLIEIIRVAAKATGRSLNSYLLHAARQCARRDARFHPEIEAIPKKREHKEIPS